MSIEGDKKSARIATVTKLQLKESTPSVLTSSGGRWSVVLAAPGQGSSGFYTREILKEQGVAAFPKDAKAFVGHDPVRNPKDMIGTYPDGAWYSDDLGPDYPEGALVSELQVFPHYKDFIDSVGPHAMLSIYMDGDVDVAGNVTAIYPSKDAGADLVSYGGLTGSGLKEKLHESYRENKPTDETSAVDKETKEKMEKEILDAINASVKAAIDALATAPKVKTEAEVQAEIDAKVEAEVGAKVDEALAGYEEKVTAIDAAELLPSQVESLKAEARKGHDVTPLIESAKKVVAEFKALKETARGNDSFRINESHADTDSYQIKGLKL